MTKDELEKGNALSNTLNRVSSFLEKLEILNPDEEGLQVSLPEVGELMQSGWDVLPISRQHPLLATLGAELCFWLMERLPAIEASLKDEFEAL